MGRFSLQMAARKLGIGVATLHRYVEEGKVPAPEPIRIGSRSVRAWSDQDVERVREILPKIANGRKTRYQKLREKERSAPAGVPVPHKKRKPKKK